MLVFDAHSSGKYIPPFHELKSKLPTTRAVRTEYLEAELSTNDFGGGGGGNGGDGGGDGGDGGGGTGTSNKTFLRNVTWLFRNGS